MRRATELECQSVIVEAAKRGGWRVHAQRAALRQSGKWSTAISGDAGFCDLVLAHPVRGVLAVELKRKPNAVEPAQAEWLKTLGAHIRAEVWWVPEEMPERCRWLIEGDNL